MKIVFSFAPARTKGHFPILCLLIALLAPLMTVAQSVSRDSLLRTPEDTVYTRSSGRLGAIATPVVRVRERYSHSNKTSVLQAVNSLPGIRMEERSPGSYRLNMRGSSLRSPFGVRNVRVYWNDIPLTDPGGNTYFNQLAFNNFSSITFEKSTTSTIYGAGTGGQVLIRNVPATGDMASVELLGGSYGLKTLLASATIGSGAQVNRISYAHNEAAGYRQQSAMRRDNLSWLNNIDISKRQRLSIGLLYTDMYYQTPGGLTEAEYKTDPRAARPAAGAFPSATAARAAIFQKNLTGGITYTNDFSKVFSNTATIYGAYNRVENSAIRNYEKRNEPHFGGRTVFTFNKKFDDERRLEAKAGVEVQSGRFNVKVHGNRGGIADTIQTNDDIALINYNIFSGLSYTTGNEWNYTAYLSYSKSRIGVQRLSDSPVRHQPFSFSNEIVPRLGVSKRFGNSFSMAAWAAKGFSAPSVAELLPSTGIINNTLQAEKGWNYEVMLRANPFRRWNFEASLFRFRLTDAIVQRRDAAGADYFINAGGTRQNGIEASASYTYVTNPGAGVLEDGKLYAAYTYSDYKYAAFVKDQTDFSGKLLPGIPARALSLLGDIYFKKGWYLIGSYYGASPIFLNDANSAAAPPYQLLMVKAGIDFSIRKINLNIYAGADNLLNQTYSLGNDINAAGGRYYNAAPARNYFLGAAISIKKIGGII